MPEVPMFQEKGSNKDKTKNCVQRANPAVERIRANPAGEKKVYSAVERIRANPAGIRNALIIEDIREAEIELKGRGYDCSRITHNEVLSSAGTEYTGKLLKGDYSLLWVSTPNDRYIGTPQKKSSTHWRRSQRWIQK